MTARELASFRRWGLWRIQGRRAFIGSAHRLGLDIAYSTYVMEQAALEPAITVTAA